MKNDIRLVIVGDVFPTKINESLFIDGDAKSLLDNQFIDIIKKADYSICNMEGALTNSDESKDKSGAKIKADVRAAAGFKAMGFSAVSMANNHVLDYGVSGYYDSLKAMKDNNIDVIGVGDNADSIVTHKKLELGGHTIVLYCVAETLFNIPDSTHPGANLYDDYKTIDEIRELKKGCDYLFVIYHGGMKRTPYSTPWIRKRFHRMADAGADLIVSQHTHAIGFEEQYKNTHIQYGTGNFLFHKSKTPGKRSLYGLMLEVRIDFNRFEVIKHFAERSGKGIIYKSDYDMNQFNELTRRNADGDPFDKEFSEYSKKYRYRFFEAFRGISDADKEAKESMSYDDYADYMTGRYTKKQLLTVLKYLEAEEFREYAIRGIKDMIAEKNIIEATAPKTEPVKKTPENKKKSNIRKAHYYTLPDNDSENFLRRMKKAYPEKFGSLTEDERIKLVEHRKRTAVAVVEYDAFDFWDKTDEEIDNYITSYKAMNSFHRAMKSISSKKILRDKFLSYERLKDFYKRDMIRGDSKDEFLNFCKKHQSFIMKDPAGTGGKEIEFVNLAETGLSPEEYYVQHVENKGLVLEEILTQGPELAKFHPQSINTVRPITYCENGEVKFLLCIMRIGRGESKVDNLSSGGICVKVDPETGTIISGAVNRTNREQMDRHPDTGIVFRGSKLPNWEELRSVVTNAAKQLQDPPFVGWDMAYTDKGWLIIEANWQPTLREIQMLTGHGLRADIREMTGIDFHL